MINPHVCYILGFVVALVVYSLGWSEFYPRLSYSLLSFLLVTVAAHVLLAIKWVKTNPTSSQKNESRLNPWAVTAFLYLLWSIDFLYEGGIPLVKVLLKIPFDYKLFGAPSLHVLAVSFSSFYCVHLFYSFVASKRKIFFWLFILNLLPSVLIISRAMLFFNLASSCFVWLLCQDKVPYKKIALAIPIVIVLLYLFGVAGTERVSFEAKSEYNTGFFLENAGATKHFRESSVPKEFFWSYFYISSPVANLQLNVATHIVEPITLVRFLEFINNEVLFESISKRINGWLLLPQENEYRIKEQFNASTIYSKSYSYLGWIGMIMMASIILIIPSTYFRLVKESPYVMESIAILCTIFLFMSYDNTIRAMGLGFQLVYPLLLPILEKQFVRFTSNRT